MKLKEILKEKKTQVAVIAGVFVGTAIVIVLCKFAIWFWNLIF